MTNLSDYTYETIIRMTIDEYIHNHGEAKFHKLIERISTSNKISGRISLSRYKNIPPGYNDILYTLSESRFFMFSNNYVLCRAALLTLQRWNEEVNSSYHLLNEKGLKERAILIINALQPKR